MKNTRVGSGTMLVEPNTYRRQKLGAILNSDPTSLYTENHEDEDDLSNQRHSNASTATPTGSSSNNISPLMMSPWNQVTSSPYNKSPWSFTSSSINFFNHLENGLIGSLVRQEGHIYSLAVSGDLLYTGSDSKNIRVWKHMKDYTGFKSNSGLVKTIVISGEKIFTGHQDGKIRVWKGSHKNPSSYKRVGSLPKFKDYVKSSMNPKNYVEVKPNRNAVKVKHFDAVSSLSLDEEEGLLYSGSWDKTLKVWRVSDSKCVESIQAHDDAVNTVVSASAGYVLTGSADGTVKMWKREPKGKKTKHELDRIVLKQENAVTSLAVNRLSTVVYCGSSDGLVNYWDRDLKNNGVNHGGVLKGHKLAVLCLAAAGSLIFSGSADNNVCVWKREESGTHSCLSVLTGHMGPVKCIAVKEEPDEGVRPWIVYTGSLDKSVKVWRVSEHVHELKVIQDSGPTYDSSPRGSNYSSPANRNTSSSFNSRTSTESLDSPVPGFSYSSPKKHSNSVTNTTYSPPKEHALSHGGASFDSSAPQLSYSPPKTHTNFVGNNGKSNNPHGTRKPEHATSHGGASYFPSDPESSTARTNLVSNNESNTGNSISSKKAEHAPSHGGASNSYSSPTTKPHSVRTIRKSNLNSNTNNGKSEHEPSRGGASYDPTVVAGGIGKVNLTPNNSNFNIKMSEEVASHGGASYDSPITGILSRYSSSTHTISVSNGSSNTTSNTNSNKGLKSPVPDSSNTWQNLSSKYGNGEEKRRGDFDARSNNHLQCNGYQNRRRL